MNITDNPKYRILCLLGQVKLDPASICHLIIFIDTKKIRTTHKRSNNHKVTISHDKFVYQNLFMK